jgi:hypothetical protein
MASTQNHLILKFYTHYCEYVQRPGKWIQTTLYMRDVPFSRIVWC